MYADDTTLTSTINTFNDNTNNDNVETSLNAELLKINEWLQINKLSLNISKSKYMIFQKVDKDVEHLTLNIDNTNIERVYEFNFFRITIRRKPELEKTSWKNIESMFQKNRHFK